MQRATLNPCPSVFIRGLFCLFTASLSAPAADGWLRLTTPHFELFTDAGESRGSQAILYFEQARSFFEQASPVRKPDDSPVRLVMFRDLTTFAQYRPNNYAIAFYYQSQNRDYILMGQSDEGVFRSALHEYMHLMVRHSGLKLPLWLNEGWAEVYSTMHPLAKGGVAVGDLIQPRVDQLEHDSWLPIRELVDVRPGSPLYNEATRISMFYSQSWALAHMLYLAPDYRSGFHKFLSALQQGKSVDECFQTAWGKSQIVIFADLQNYLHRKKITGVVYEVKVEKPLEAPVSLALSSHAADVMLADLLTSMVRYNDAQTMLERLKKEDPADPETLRSLGYVAWAQGKKEEALTNFILAAKHGIADLKMLFHLGVLSRSEKHPPAEAQAAYERALALKPDYLDARLELAAVFLSQQLGLKALEVLAPVKEVDEDHAAGYFNALGYGYSMLGNVAKAKLNAEKAQKFARNDLDRAQSANVLRWVAAQPPAK